MQAHDIVSRAKPRRLTRLEYDQLVAQGLFRNERVELIEGIVVEMAPIGPRHDDLTAGRYGRTRSVSSSETLAPAAFPDLVLRVGDLFV